jgi:hypothetical protein
MTPESITATLIKLDIDGRQSLFVVLAADGLVNRLGTGSVDNSENDLFIGRTSEPLFSQLRARVQPQWMAQLGGYDVPDKVGSACTLSVLFQGSNGEEGGLEFSYGSESQGPPAEICAFVTEAVRLTDPWYEQQKRMVRESKKKKKPWWRPW